MNFHFREDGRAIYNFAKELPGEQRKEVVELGKEITTARSKKNFPKGVRNVATSLVVGQGMWYFVCPALYSIPEVRESPLGWVVSGGLDKLFFASDDLIYQTGGYSAQVASAFASRSAGSVAIGAAALGAELATDFSRCYIEYWTQKKYGIVADGAARAYGQVRPFPLRYSSLEAYQKIISYALRPWTIGTEAQIYSSVYGVLGSIWRTGPQLGIVLTAGRTIDAFFKKISEWTGLAKVAKRIAESAAEKERAAMGKMREIVGEQKITELKLRLSAESKTFWKWNPFRPAISSEDARDAARAIMDYESMRLVARNSVIPESYARDVAREAIVALGIIERAYGRRRLLKFAPASAELQQADAGSKSEIFEKVVAQLTGE